jgi:hypothetical protein
MTREAKSTRLTVNDNDNSRNIPDAYKYMMGLYKFAILRADKMGSIFQKGDYKWKIGIDVMADLSTSDLIMETLTYLTPTTTLFGIPVEIDTHDPHNIQLWENITNKV